MVTDQKTIYVRFYNIRGFNIIYFAGMSLQIILLQHSWNWWIRNIACSDSLPNSTSCKFKVVQTYSLHYIDD